MDLARCLSVLSTAFNSAEFTCSCSKCPRLEESGRPEPFVHSHPVHDSILNEHGMFTNQPGISARFVARHRTRLNSGRVADDPGTERLGAPFVTQSTLWHAPNAHLGVDYRAGRSRLVSRMYCATRGASGRCGL